MSNRTPSDIDTLADDYTRSLADLSPVLATEIGLSGYDHLMGETGPEVHDAIADLNRDTLAKLRKADLPVNVQAVNTNRGSRTRVRVGPFNTLKAADKAAVSVRALALEADVIRQ